MSPFVKKAIITLAAANIGLVVLYGFLYTYVGDSESQQQKLREEINAGREGQQALEKLQKSVASTDSQRQKLASYFVRQEDTASFLSEVEALSESSGALVQITSVETNEENENPALIVAMRSQGTFREIFHLVTLIETLPYTITLSSATLEEGVEEADSPLNEEPSFQQEPAAEMPSTPVSSGTSTSSTSSDLVEQNNAPQQQPATGGNLWTGQITFRLESFHTKETLESTQSEASENGSASSESSNS